MALTWATKPEPTEHWGLLRPRTFRGHDMVLLAGPMRLEIRGSSAGLVSTRLSLAITMFPSTTCGSTAPANGRGWAGRMWVTSSERTVLRVCPPPATILGDDSALLVGPIRLGISGFSGGLVTPPWMLGSSTTCGS